jgi:hypothetical protein
LIRSRSSRIAWFSSSIEKNFRLRSAATIQRSTSRTRNRRRFWHGWRGGSTSGCRPSPRLRGLLMRAELLLSQDEKRRKFSCLRHFLCQRA